MTNIVYFNKITDNNFRVPNNISNFLPTLLLAEDGIGKVLSCNSHKIALKSHHGKYVVAKSDGSANADSNTRGPWEVFIVEKLGENRIALKSYDGKYLAAENAETGKYNVNANRAKRGAWETFFLENHHGGLISLKTAHGRYVVAEKDGRLLADRRVVDDWEKFLPECVGSTGRYWKER